MNIKEKIRTFLEANQILSLATTDGKTVSACNLHYYSDEYLNLYFVSRPERDHSKNIMDHKEVAVAIYDQSQVTDNVVSGVQIKGICTLFTVDDGIEQRKAFYEKFPAKYQGEITEILENIDFRSFYKIEPKWIRLINGRSWDLPHEITL